LISPDDGLHETGHLRMIDLRGHVPNRCPAARARPDLFQDFTECS
jgi:hypothetical protein